MGVLQRRHILTAIIMVRRGLSILMGLVVATAAFPSSAAAGVVVLANHTDGKVTFAVIQPDGRQVRRALDREEVVPVPADDADNAVTVLFDDGGWPRRQTLRGNGIYDFRSDGNRLELVERPLPGLPAPAGLPAPTPPARPRDAVCTIPVKILADDKEPTVRRVWEKRYRERVAAASDIIERYCRVRFEVVAVGTWHSEDGTRELGQLIEEFERTVKPAPARLAIGFTGQYQALRGDKHMGGTRGPFRPHILIREWGQPIAEPDRLEMLVHELGHFLGAVHSAESRSVMQPDIGGRQARARSFHIGFDAPNTLAMYLVGEELRAAPSPDPPLPASAGQQGPAESGVPLAGCRAARRSGGAAVLGHARPVAGVDRRSARTGASRDRRRGTVVRAVTEAARKNRRLPEGTPDRAAVEARLDGDQLTEYYVRQAAAAARQLPPAVAPGAFLLGLGLALDDSAMLREAPIAGTFWQQIESPSERAARLAVLGTPTMRTRHDLAQHFTVSAALVVLVGPRVPKGLASSENCPTLAAAAGSASSISRPTCPASSLPRSSGLEKSPSPVWKTASPWLTSCPSPAG